MIFLKKLDLAPYFKENLFVRSEKMVLEIIDFQFKN